ncbi:acetyl-CoA carboxylase / biotin carboxylase 1 [Nematocida displodere]|uniref:Acetyl-CoA carboxylase / biotin carboxylase 1 n=1 Tax=Nematocida displodere TaxID=1805483 RepID=A0A177EBW4_9MICR|nr:acetyl-CoA carboxylase / biotin carboxylase 1 [Nematocida displodere]
MTPNTIEAFLNAAGGSYRGNKIFVANNSLAALKFILSMNDFSFRRFGRGVFEFYGLARKSDKVGESKYLEYLTDYRDIDTEEASGCFSNVEVICETAEHFKCSYVWPGWGHASENPELPKACARRNLLFLGPTEEAMTLLGQKISANKLADQCGIPTIPWMEVGAIEETKEFCRKVEYPIMIKTSDGGGGKGIREIEKEEKLEESIEIVKAEVRTEEVFVTKLLKDIKHIEVQVLADTHGEAVVLSTRDCTLQRRNQKLIEEGPATLPDGMLPPLMEQAQSLVKTANYSGACTVEFIFTVEDRKIYFLEANPRLQVEHTVSELLTDSNLCAAQWLISTGVAIATLREMGVIKPEAEKRHVVAARIIAECPNSAFSPSTGKVAVSGFFPSGTVGYFGVDSGVIGQYNDSQFGHVFGVGGCRKEAVDSLKMILSSLRISGEVKTLNKFLLDLISTDAFETGAHTTAFTESYQRRWVEQRGFDAFFVLAYVALFSSAQKITTRTEVIFRMGGILFTAHAAPMDAFVYGVEICGGFSVIEISKLADAKYRIKNLQEESQTIYFTTCKSISEIVCCGHTYQFENGTGGNEVLAAGSGRVVRFLKDDYVTKGEEYLEIECMKNIMRLSAPKEGKLTQLVASGDTITAGDVIATIVGGVEEEILAHTEPISHRNTAANYTLSLFSQFPVPEQEWRYEEEFVIAALHKYTLLSSADHTQSLDLYISKALTAFQNMNTPLTEHIPMLTALKYAISSKKDKNTLCMVQSLLDRSGLEKAKKEIGDVLARIQTQGTEFLKEKAALELSPETMLSLCLVPQTSHLSALLWVKRTFAKEGTFTKNGVHFTISGALCTLLWEDVPREEAGMVYLVRKKTSQPPSIKGTVTTIEISEEAPAAFRTYQNTVEDTRYAEIDPLLSERLGVDKLPTNSVLVGVHWNRRIFVYKTEGRVSMRCVLSSHDLLEKDAVVDALFQEVKAAYILADVEASLSVVVCVSAEMHLDQEGLASLMKRKILPRVLTLTEYDLEEVIVRGSILPGGMSGHQNTMEGCAVLSPCAGELPFILYAITHRGFNESSLFISGHQIFYAIDEMEIKHTPSTPCKFTEDLSAKTIDAVYGPKRKKARSLGTAYIYDICTLLEVLTKEMHKGLAVTELFLGAKETNLRMETTEVYETGVPAGVFEVPEHAMKGWRFKSGKLDFLLVGSDITENSGAFSISEDIFFSKCAAQAQALKIPFVYVSSNSGAKIQVFEKLKENMLYLEDKNTIYLSEEAYRAFENKDQIQTKKTTHQGATIYEITAILGEFGMGVENLSYSAEIAKQMARAYNAIPTLTYATGRAVGIGAYLASIGERVIQKQDSPIILTGFQALNRLIQQSLYQSNIEIGGPGILAKNGVVHRIVTTETEGVLEILRWIDFVHTSSRYLLPSPPQNFPPPLQIENFNPEEIVETVSDKNSFVEYLAVWAPNVRVGRMKLNGVSCGVIYPRCGTVTTKVPCRTSGEREVLWIENVLLPETSKKIAQAVKDFSNEGLDVLILLNWKGFSAGHLDMFDGILQAGSKIIQNITTAKTKIFSYICPNSELRGGSWVVFDKFIGSSVRFAAHPTSKGGVIHPDGLASIKFKEPEVQSILTRSEIKSTSKTNLALGRQFCDLHDTSTRMLHMEAIHQILNVSELKHEVCQYFTSPSPPSAQPQP